MKQRIKEHWEDILFAIFLTFVILISGLFISIFIEMLNDHRCYNLPPQEFFNDPKCERYWDYRINEK